jgi:hypothetical protein
MKKYLLPSLLVAGCTQYCGVDPVSPTPIYPPLFDIRPLKQILEQSHPQAQKLKQFVENAGDMVPLQCAVDTYIMATQDLYYQINNTPTAQVQYRPWQTR